MAVLVYVYDERAGWILPYLPPNSNVTSIKVIAEATDSIAYIAQKILWMLPEGEKIMTFYLCGHGNVGFVQFGLGLNQSSACQLAALKGKFDELFPEIQIHACLVAGSGDTRGVGYMLCRAIASATGAFVTAAANLQYGDPLYMYEGPTITVGPNG
jgi:hypothetical protein